MELPNEKETRELLLSTHFCGIPSWTSEQKQNAYTQLKQLYEHWFRHEVNDTDNSRIVDE